MAGLLYLSREALHAALVGSNGKLHAAQQERINRVASKVDELRAMLDEQYHKDGLHKDASEGAPVSPLYLGNYPDLQASVVEVASEEVARRVREQREGLS